jgi:hypothetical protein
MIRVAGFLDFDNSTIYSYVKNNLQTFLIHVRFYKDLIFKKKLSVTKFSTLFTVSEDIQSAC